MRDSIYELLNDMNNQPESYHTEEINEKEINKWKKAFQKKYQKKAKKWGRYVAAAVLGVIILGSTLGPIKKTVYACAKTVTYDLSQLLGISEDLDPYRTVVGEKLTQKGYTVTLNEVVMDDESLYISDTLTVPGKIETDKDMMSYRANPLVYINGRLALTGSSGSSSRADEYNIVSEQKIELPDIDTSQKLDIEIEYFVNEERIGSFKFSASGKELALNTLSVPMNQNVALPDGSTVTFTKYTSNAMGQNIYFTKTSEDYTYDFLLKGEDNLGNPVEFSVRYSEQKRGRMEVETVENGFINSQATALTLTPYAVEMPESSGKMNSDYKPVGDSFTIDISGKK